MKRLKNIQEMKHENAKVVSLEERRSFLRLGLKVTGVFVGGSILSLVPTQKVSCELLGSSVVGTYPYQPHYSMIIYTDKCIDCERCIEACNKTNNVPSYGFRNIILNRKKTGIASSKFIREFLPVLCNQCNKPPCVRVCPTKATYKDKKNGIVMMNESLCIGCKACMTSCPYNARYYNREIQSVDKCDFCYRKRLHNGETNTACAQACPTGALFFGDLSDQDGEFYKILHKPEQTIMVLRPESGSMPNVFYL
ncbi:MAG: 4Fe-4S dicluster domain-containing protein [Deltaproteobacteria bacterium]|nr:MAG: 4Fe-4S dicluster domain-containing protein [Deltaproteobacteria bacterium]